VGKPCALSTSCGHLALGPGQREIVDELAAVGRAESHEPRQQAGPADQHEPPTPIASAGKAREHGEPTPSQRTIASPVHPAQRPPNGLSPHPSTECSVSSGITCRLHAIPLGSAHSITSSSTSRPDPGRYLLTAVIRGRPATCPGYATGQGGAPAGQPPNAHVPAEGDRRSASSCGLQQVGGRSTRGGGVERVATTKRPGACLAAILARSQRCGGLPARPRHAGPHPVCARPAVHSHRPFGERGPSVEKKKSTPTGAAGASRCSSSRRHRVAVGAGGCGAG
jgi:hypothetical protein